MDKINGLKVVLFDAVIERLCDLMIEECMGDELIELVERLTQIAELFGYEKQLVASACAAGLRKVDVEINAVNDPNRKSRQTQLMRANLRFLSFFYILAQIRPKSLKKNEEWAYQVTKVSKKDQREIALHNASLFLALLPDRELKVVFKGEELKRVRKWRKNIKE